MINIFYATFIPGLQSLIADAVKERLSDVRIHKLLDGAVLFETLISYDKLNLCCFNNIFEVINILDSSQEISAESNDSTEIILEKHIEYFLRYTEGKPLCSSAVNTEPIVNNNKKFNTFRIVVSNENVPASIDEELRTEAEKAISGLSGLKVNRALPDTEFWFLYRNEVKSQGQSFSVFMKRLTLHPSWEKTLHKGELPPPLAWALCRLASLSYNDAVLDPFCGYGSIPEAAMKYFHITEFHANDNDRQVVSYTAERFKKRKISSFFLHNGDYSKLPLFIEEKSIDAIITDPPWGQYKDIADSGFLKKMFNVFYRLLKGSGRAVVLYTDDDKLIKAAESSFILQESIPILLSGRKAVIYVFAKKLKAVSG
ncbi:MAG: methyltransferase domain-containing protein [Treponema sp.]|nr:methyltransferase domain-containing protein [Treponema sp.]